MKINNILCPTDFSETSGKAIEYAEFLASEHQADITLLHVVDQIEGSSYYEVLALTPMQIAQKMETHALENMSEIAEKIKGAASVHEVVRHGKTWVEICKAAKDMDIDIIVIGSHGRTGLSHVLLGSVAETVVRHADCAVLVVRAGDREFDET